MTSVPFFMTFFGAVIFYALALGGGPERSTALSFVIALAGTLLHGLWSVPGQFRIVPIYLFVVDAILLVALAIIAVRANRWWPIPVAGCQLVAVLGHAGKMLFPDMIPNGYAFLTTIWSWPMTAFLAIGTWKHRQRLKAGIFAYDWKPS